MAKINIAKADHSHEPEIDKFSPFSSSFLIRNNATDMSTDQT